MIFKNKRHNNKLYNTLLLLSRNIYFYDKVKLNDNFESRIYLMFFHFSIMMIIFKKKGKKFDQYEYDSLFFQIENNLRELGFGDVSVNKKMKELNKILYDILLKIENRDIDEFNLNKKVILKYFTKWYAISYPTLKNGRKYRVWKLGDLVGVTRFELATLALFI